MRTTWIDLIEADADKIVDLSVTLSEHLPATWPEHMPFAHKNWSWFEEDELPTGACTCSLGPYVTHFFILDEHAGTHVDARLTLPTSAAGAGRGRDSAEKLDLSKLIGPAAVVDLRHLDGEAENGASPAITVAHLEAWEAEHGRFEPGEIVLLLTGWSKHYVHGRGRPGLPARAGGAAVAPRLAGPGGRRRDLPARARRQHDRHRRPQHRLGRGGQRSPPRRPQPRNGSSSRA